jgi:2-oxo-4-hydroxy-4-carboxy-5-ureidoimidazoline decarboxylase
VLILRGTGISIMLTKAEFLKIYGGIYEHSPWIAEAAYGAEGIEAIHAAMKAAVTSAAHDKKLALIRAHPELGSKVKMAEASVQEQAGAGLDRCSAEEFAEFQKLNADYNKKFGFPFIVAVKGLSRPDILQAFRKRMNNDPAAEFETALEEIHKIAWFRLQAL